MPVTVFFIGSLSAVSFLTAWLSLLIYRCLPDSWVCDFNESPGPVHRSDNRCPRRRLSLFCMSAAVFFLMLLKIRGISLDPSGPAAEGKCALSSLPFWECVFFILSALILLPAALSDIDYYIIPDQICVLTAAAALLNGVIQEAGQGTGSLSADEAVSFILSSSGLLSAFLLPAAGGLLCGFLMLLSCGLSRLFSGKEGVGMGDVKLMTACGALASSAAGQETWAAASLSVFVVAVMSSAVWFSILLLSGRVSYGEACPLAPWIVLSSLLVLALF